MKKNIYIALFLILSTLLVNAQSSRTPELPPGTILTFAGQTCPSGYIEADGAEYNRTGAYSALFAAIGTAHGTSSPTKFNVPDYRGRFLRMIDRSANRDADKSSRTAMAVGGNSGNNIGSIQTDAFKAHRHLNVVVAGANTGGLSQATSAIAWQAIFRALSDRDDYYLGGHNAEPTAGRTSEVGAGDTRPVNAYVLYCIKY